MSFNFKSSIKELDNSKISEIIDYKIENLEKKLQTNVALFAINAKSDKMNIGISYELLDANKIIKNELATYYLERAASYYETKKYQEATHNVNIALDLNEHCDFKEVIIPFTNGIIIEQNVHLESIQIIRNPKHRKLLSSILEGERGRYLRQKELIACQNQLDILLEKQKKLETNNYSKDIL